MIDLIETIPFPERQKWLSEHLEPMIEQYNSIFRSLSITAAASFETGMTRDISQELQYLEEILTDLESLRHFLPSKD